MLRAADPYKEGSIRYRGNYHLLNLELNSISEFCERLLGHPEEGCGEKDKTNQRASEWFQKIIILQYRDECFNDFWLKHGPEWCQPIKVQLIDSWNFSTQLSWTYWHSSFIYHSCAIDHLEKLEQRHYLEERQPTSIHSGRNLHFMRKTLLEMSKTFVWHRV